MSRRVQVLFLVALVGVLALVGLLVQVSVGAWGSVPYALVVVGLLVVGARRAREPALPAGRTCTCCTSTVHDPVQVV